MDLLTALEEMKGVKGALGEERNSLKKGLATNEKEKEKILRLRGRWGKIYSKGIKVMKKIEEYSVFLITLLIFLRYPKEIKQFIYTIN
jgi:adenosine/AMP kinase